MSEESFPVTANLLATLFLECTSSNVSVIHEAEKRLSRAVRDPQFVTSLFQLLSTQSSTIPFSIQQMGMIYLKNLVRQSWDVPEGSQGFCTTDREIVRDKIIYLAVQYANEPSVYRQIIAVIRLIAAVDFPDEWPSLLYKLVELGGLTSVADPLTSNVALNILDEVLQRYQNESRTQEILKELKYSVLPVVQEFIVNKFPQLIQILVQTFPGSNIPLERITVNQLFYCTRLLISLISVDLPEYIENHQEDFFKGCQIFLKYQNKHLDLPQDELNENTGSVLNVKKEMCKFLTLYASRFSEEFEPFVISSTSDVLDFLVLLMSESGESDVLDGPVIAALNYLSVIARYTWKPCPFSDPPNRLNDMCHFIIIPNLQQRDTDLQLIQDQPSEFIRRNLDDSENDTRRGAAVGLVNALMQHFEAKVSALLSNYVTQLLNASCESQADGLQSQRLKDAAIYLVIALVVKCKSQVFGVSQIRHCVNISDFFKRIAPEIMVSENLTNVTNVLVRCTTFKFLITFRNQLEKSTLLEVFPQILRNLAIKDPVIHTHAAVCLESLLLARDSSNPTESFSSTRNLSCCPLKFTPQDVSPLLSSSLDALLQLLLSNSGIQDNEYLMRAVMKILMFQQQAGGLEKNCDAASRMMYSQVCIPATTFEILRNFLAKQCESSINPFFVHYLFESLALCIKDTASSGSYHKAEALLLELLLSIIKEPDHDFTPYALQMMGLLLDTATTASSMYVQLIDHLLEPAQWSSTARVPAIIRVLSAVCRKCSLFESCLQTRLETFLLRYQYCLNHKRLCNVAFEFLDDMLTYLSMDMLETYIKPLVITLLRRLKDGKSSKLCRSAVFSLSLLICRHKSVFLPAMLNTIQPNLAQDFLTHIFFVSWDETSCNLYVKKVGLLALIKLCTTHEVCNHPGLLEKALDLCATFMGAVSKPDISRTKPASALDDTLSAGGTFLYDKPTDEYQSLFHVLRCAQVPNTSKEITEVSRDNLLSHIRECLNDPTLRVNGPQCASWSKIVEILSVC